MYGKKEVVMKKKVIVILSIIVLLIAANMVGFYTYADVYYKAGHDAIFASQISTDTVDVSKTKIGGNNALVFAPHNPNPKAGIIMYPGGKVQYEAYAPLMQECANRGILCVLVEMPFNLAFFDGDEALDVIKEYPYISDWYVMGHSLGGAIAAGFVRDNYDLVKGIIFLGAYSTYDLTNKNLKILSIYGSEDKVMNRDRYDSTKSNLGSDLVEVVLPGGCHSYFGDYGMQEGDGNPTISREEQMHLTADAICDIICRKVCRKEGP